MGVGKAMRHRPRPHLPDTDDRILSDHLASLTNLMGLETPSAQYRWDLRKLEGLTLEQKVPADKFAQVDVVTLEKPESA